MFYIFLIILIIKLYIFEENSLKRERYNRTKNDRMEIVFEINKNEIFWTKTCIDILNKIVNEYNNLTHATIGEKPIKVNKENEKKLLKSVFKFTPQDFIRNSKFIIKYINN